MEKWVILRKGEVDPCSARDWEWPNTGPWLEEEAFVAVVDGGTGV
jgi:hypothetical protein